jgi:hypothetical protein
MFLDRVFGVIAAFAFLLGLVCQVGWLIDVVEPSLLYQLTAIFFALSIPTFLYLVLYVGKRDGLAYTLQGELDFRTVQATLPAWARVTSNWLLGVAGAFTVAAATEALWPSLLPNGTCHPGTGAPDDCYMVNWIMAAMTAAFGAIAFVQALNLLRTSTRH